MPSITATVSGINNSTTVLYLDGAAVIGFCGMRWRNGFRAASVSTVTIAAGVATITGVSLIAGSADFVVGQEIAFWSGSATEHVTISTYAAGTITGTTTAANGVTIPGGEWDYIYLAQHPLDRITADRVCYLEVRGGDGLERIQVTAIRPARSVSAQTYQVSIGTFSTSTFPQALYCTVTRGVLGSTAYAATDEDVFYDITIPVRMAQDRQPRFAYGAPSVELDADLRHADLQEGDVVSFDWPSLFFRRIKATRGMDSTVLWEITRIGLDKATGRISMKLVWISTP